MSTSTRGGAGCKAQAPWEKPKGAVRLRSQALLLAQQPHHPFQLGTG